MNVQMIFSILAVSVLSLAAGAQGATTTTMGATSPTTAALTDSQIAHIVVTANKIDIDGGKMAQSKTKDKEIKSFAKQMVTDHTSVNKQATDLAKKLKVTPEDNSTSQTLMKAAQDNMASLKNLKGKEFDKAYVDQEVAFHQQVLDTIDQSLIPNAKNTELKALLEKTRPAIQAHLEHAQHMQSTMTK